MISSILIKISVLVAISTRVAIIGTSSYQFEGAAFNHARQRFPSKNSYLYRTRERSQFLEKRCKQPNGSRISSMSITSRCTTTNTKRSFTFPTLFAAPSATLTPSTKQDLKEDITSSQKNRKDSTTTTIVLVCGFESFNRELYNLAASKVPNVNLIVFADTDIRAGGSAVCR
jgi:hypothetical protein